MESNAVLVRARNRDGSPKDCSQGDSGIQSCFFRVYTLGEMAGLLNVDYVKDFEAPDLVRHVSRYEIPADAGNAVDLEAARRRLDEIPPARDFVNNHLHPDSSYPFPRPDSGNGDGREPPTPTQPPTILGALEAGTAPMIDLGAWQGSQPLSFSYAWLRCLEPDSGCFVIPRVATASYTPTIMDLSLCLQLVVTARNRFGETTVGTPVACRVTMPDTQELSAATALRPYLLFDSAEIFRPLSINHFFLEAGNRLCTNVVGGGDDCTAPTQISYNPCGLYGLECQPDSDFPALESYDYIEVGDVLGWRPDANGGAESAIYYNHTVRGHFAYFDYWLFYRHNPGPAGLSPHEGDWEGVTVVGLADDPVGHPVYVAFAQHEGKPAAYLRDNVEWFGTRPLTYVAQGSHASYPRPCFVDVCLQHRDFPVPEGRHDGLIEWGWNARDDCGRLCVLPIPEYDIDPSRAPFAASWAGWTGQWGRIEPFCERFCAPPDSPGRQPRYREPWEVRWDRPLIGARHLAATELSRNCLTWLGEGVNAIVCDPLAIEAAIADGTFANSGDATVRVRSSDGVSPNAPGLAQLTGDPLAAGDVVDVVGRVSRSASVVLLVEAEDDAELVVLEGGSLGLVDGGSKAIVLRRNPDGTIEPRPNKLPTCGAATTDPAVLWPPTGKLTRIALTGIADPDGDPVVIEINSVTQDEPVGASPDAARTPAADELMLRAERAGGGDGRVYRIAFKASDGYESCSRVVTVSVPHDRARGALDSVGRYDSFG